MNIRSLRKILTFYLHVGEEGTLNSRDQMVLDTVNRYVIFG